ncbi:hypothetical protein SAMN06265377_3105 [Flagellimonas pacifica]|uniref:DUF1574 domain-containing protein n=2 Tax=Flagellimonas pacifica TaxID=1247520 RepID=A0A285MVX9_9FLAO|nr:hypothetical protein SAMN06265377_3105 [Allomuricauda parva]
MKSNLIKQVLAFSAIWFFLMYLICLFLPFHYFNAEYPMWKSKMEVMESNNTFSNLIIGDSRVVAGVNPDALGSNYYNLALGGGTPMEGYYSLKQMLNSGKKVDTIIVSYAPLHFEQSEMFWDRQVKYNFYELDEIEEIFNELNTENETFWEYEGDKNFEESEKGSLMRRAYKTYFKFPTELRTELSKSFLLRGYTNYAVYNEIKNRRGCFDFGRADFSNDLNVEANRVQFVPKKVLVSSLEKMFELARENDIIVMYTSLPMNQTSYNALHSEYRNGVEQMNSYLKLKHPYVEFVNPALVFYDDTYFGDASHLNKKGRERFTFELKQLVTKKLFQVQNSLTGLEFQE